MKDNNLKNIELLNQQIEELTKNTPPDGYLRFIKKKYFPQKTNWAMLSTIIAIASLAVTAFIFYMQSQ
jgi:hypothetical protein